MSNIITSFVATFAATPLIATPAHTSLLGRDIYGHAVAGNADSSVFL